MKTLAEESKREVIEHVEDRAAYVASEIFYAQKVAMDQSAQELFDGKVAPTLKQLTTALQSVVDRVRRPWDDWLTHLATAVLCSAGSGWLVYCLLGK